MDRIEKLLKYLESFSLESLSSDWVKDIWDQDFTDFEPIQEDIQAYLEEKNYLIKELVEFKRLLQPWCGGLETESGQGLWTVLVEKDVQHKSLLAFLFYIMETGKSKVAIAARKQAGILAADVYVALLTIPGSGAFNIFHHMLFQKAIESLKAWKTISAAPKRKKDSVSSQQSQKSKKSRPSKRSKKQREEEEEEEYVEDEDEEDGVLTPAEVGRITQALFGLLQSFVRYLEGTSKDSSQIGYLARQTLVELTRLESEVVSTQLHFNKTVDESRTVAELAYKGLASFCSNKNMLLPVLKRMLPSILMLASDGKSVFSPPPRYVHVISDQALHFILYLIENRGDNAHIISCVSTLLQHIIHNTPDKAEYRTKVAETVCKIMDTFPSEEYAKVIEFTYRVSKANSTGGRMFTLDLVSVLLHRPQKTHNIEAVPIEQTVFLTRKFLVQILLSRCSDSAATVRAKAISEFSHCTTSEEPVVKGAVREILTPQSAMPKVPRTRIVPTPDIGHVLPMVVEQQLGVNQNHEQQDGTAGNQSSTAGQNTTDAASAPNTILWNTTTPTATDQGASYQTPPAGQAQPFTPSTTMSCKNGTMFVSIQLTPGLYISLVDGSGVMSLVRRRAGDLKVNVRKAAILALEQFIKFEGVGFNEADLKVIQDRCQDPSLAVRKQSLLSLTTLLHLMPENETVLLAWLNGILPLVLDRESSVSDKCLEILEETILDNIEPEPRSKDQRHFMLWKLINIMAGPKGVDMCQYFSIACRNWSRAGKLKANVMNALQTHIGKENNTGAWLLLSEIASYAPKFKSEFIMDYWKNTAKTLMGTDYSTVDRVLTVVGKVAGHLSADNLSELADDLKDMLLQFNSPPEFVTVTVQALNKICGTLAKTKPGASGITEKCFEQLMVACDKYLAEVILTENPENMTDESKVIRHLFTLGEIAQLCPKKVTKRTFMLVQSIVAAPVITSLDSSDGIPASQIPASQVPASQVPSSQDSQGTQFTQTPLSQFKGSKMSDRIRAHAFITLGKLCLQHEATAKKVVPAMARELEIATSPHIRNNVMIIMCDLCVRYTSIVDPYINSITACLKDPSALIRKQTATLLTRLLQEDFLKWKGPLFYRFVTLLVDEDPELKQFAELCLFHVLQQRHPTLFYQHFTECVFHFNNYHHHAGYNKVTQSEREKTLFQLCGKQNKDKRMTLYRKLLDHMADEHKFQLSVRLVTDILSAVVDEVLPMDDTTDMLLEDTLSILACKEIKISSARGKPQDDPINEQEVAAAIVNAAKRKIVNQVVKKNMIEHTVPTVVSLKHVLEKHRSPVHKYLMLFLLELMKDYKNEIKDILVADKQLASEIEFDLRKFEENQRQQEKDEEEKRRRLDEMQRRKDTPHGSPRLASPQRTPGSPQRPPGSPQRLPQEERSPERVEGSPQRAQGSPQRQPGTPVPAGSPLPANLNKKPMSIATFAIMNSARKAVEHARRVAEKSGLSPRRGTSATPRTGTGATPTAGPPPVQRLVDENAPPTPQRVPTDAPAPLRGNLKTPGRPPRVSEESEGPGTVQKKRVNFEEVTRSDDDESGDNTVFTESGDKIQTPTRKTRSKRLSRAISTPSAHIGNITFMQGEQNLSFIPPSPIDGSPGENITDGDSENLRSSSDVIYMNTPDKGGPKPKVWNIKSPMALKPMNLDESEDETVTDSQTKKNTRRNSKQSSDNTSGNDVTITETRRNPRRQSTDKNTSDSRTRGSRNSKQNEENNPTVPAKTKTRAARRSTKTR